MTTEEERRRAAERSLREALRQHGPAIEAMRSQLSASMSDITKQLVARGAELVSVESILKNVVLPNLTTDYGSLFSNLNLAPFDEAAVKKLLPSLDLKLDYESLFPDLASINTGALKALWPSLGLIQDAQRHKFAELIEAARRARQATLPPNWRSDEISVPEDLEALVLDEGLALAWVPPAPVVAKLFNAENANDRRRIIGSRWKSITNACAVELEHVNHKSLADYGHFARKAADALLAGSHEASQALSANLLDSILRTEFTDDDRRTITGRQDRLNIEDYPMRVAIVLGGIWGAHAQFYPSRGDKIPRGYSRHGTAHGVSRLQYSRVNAVIAVMHVVSLLRVMETDMIEVDV